MPRTRIRRLPGTAVAAALCALLLTSSAPSSAAETDSYVAMGDSYSAGNGAHSTNLSPLCGRNTYAYPSLVAQRRPHTSLTFVACQGATTADIPGQARFLGPETDYVSLTIGGNDIGFGGLILGCTGDFSPGCDLAVAHSEHAIRAELPGKLDRAYATIRAAAPHATVVVLGYARLFGDDVSCAAADGVTASEAARLNRIADDLDRVVADRAAAAGFAYVSSIRRFTGHDMCAADPWVNGKLANVADAYHPTRHGYARGLAPELRSVIG